jgi:hypothetical protein
MSTPSGMNPATYYVVFAGSMPAKTSPCVRAAGAGPSHDGTGVVHERVVRLLQRGIEVTWRAEVASVFLISELRREGTRCRFF